MHSWLNVSLTRAGPDRHVNSENQLTWHLSCVWPYCTVFEGPPSLKSIFIFAVLTFSSSNQRHNEGFLQLLWPASVQYMQTKHRKRRKLLFISAFLFFQSLYFPQRKLSSFLEHNRGTNVHDSRGLNLERKCFVTDCKTSHLSEIMFVFILLWSLVSEMDHGVVVCSLEEVCSFLVNMLPCSRDSCHPSISSLKASLQCVCFESKLLFPRSVVWHSMKPSSSQVYAAQ